MAPFCSLLAFGDSVTLGGQASRPECAWIGRLRLRLEGCHGNPVAIDNRAVGGSVIAPESAAYPPSRKPSGRERLDEALLAWPDPAPDLVLVGFGFNDARGGASADDFARQLASFLSALRAGHAGEIVVLGPYACPDRGHYGTEWGHGSPERLEEFTRRGAAEARVFGARHVALHDALARGTGLYAPDGVHPNDAGHLLIASLVYQTLVPQRKERL